ncbi:hypothetical protein OAA86_08490 [Rhodospirillales bacterium]|nr:hypothetical protein [Rhodospirillales bacterium]
MFLSKGEQRNLNECWPNLGNSEIHQIHCPSEVEEMRDYFSRRPDDFSEEEATQVANALERWHGLFVKKPARWTQIVSSNYLDCVLDILERSMLPVVLLFACLDHMLTTSKELPSISEITFIIDKQTQVSEDQWEVVIGAIGTYNQCEVDVRNALDDAAPKICRLIPDFPSGEAILSAYDEVLRRSISECKSPKQARVHSQEIVSSLSDPSAFPVVPLYLIWIFSMIPRSKWATAKLAIEKLAAEEGNAAAIYSPRIWRVVSSSSSTLNDAVENDDHAACEWLTTVLCNKIDTQLIEEIWRREICK